MEKGPAVVVMTEPCRTLRILSNDHLRPDLNYHEKTEPTQRAKQALDEIRGQSDTSAPAEADDHWDLDEDGFTWTRVHVRPRQTLYVPTTDEHTLINQDSCP